MNKLIKAISVTFITFLWFVSVNTLAVESNITVNVYTSNKIENDTSSKISENKLPDYYSMVDNPMSASTFNNPVTLQEIEEESNVIVRGTFLGVTKQEEEYDPNFGTFVYGFTRSSIRVEEVYSGNVKLGDILELFEPYYIKEQDNQTILSHHENYYPTKTGKSYIWFLSENAGANYDAFWRLNPNQFYYSPLYCERGRYPTIDTTLRSSIDVDNMSNQELDLSPNGSSYIYKQIYSDVINKYLKK